MKVVDGDSHFMEPLDLFERYIDPAFRDRTLKLANDPEFPEDAKDLGKILKREPWRVVGHPQD